MKHEKFPSINFRNTLHIGVIHENVLSSSFFSLCLNKDQIDSNRISVLSLYHFCHKLHFYNSDIKRLKNCSIFESRTCVRIVHF